MTKKLMCVQPRHIGHKFQEILFKTEAFLCHIGKGGNMLRGSQFNEHNSLKYFV